MWLAVSARPCSSKEEFRRVCSEGGQGYKNSVSACAQGACRNIVWWEAVWRLEKFEADGEVPAVRGLGAVAEAAEAELVVDVESDFPQVYAHADTAVPHGLVSVAEEVLVQSAGGEGDHGPGESPEIEGWGFEEVAADHDGDVHRAVFRFVVGVLEVAFLVGEVQARLDVEFPEVEAGEGAEHVAAF